ncbi:tyrosine-type recombinase/integrase [Litoribacter ruber]|uniref:tyrosine-type recombinase/integrase n=1 Tax=Litoribacter ruber TaxID=702568 RepID=UPI001BD9CA2C|nr:tyrosine-type recombinase/integrase [Litoribacter ruber]MBT0810017.1 tyrosine-type recombinase/integrase [Litoribacter ruber]
MLLSFIAYLQHTKRASQHTLTAYQKDLEQFEEFCQTAFETPLEDAQHAEIRAWVVDLVESGLSPRSINRKIATLRSFYKFLLKEGQIQKDPTYKIQALKTPKRLPEFISEQNVEEVLSEIQYQEDFEGQRDKMVMEFLYLTGVRLSELLNLKWKDVDLNSDLVRVLGKRQKERIIPITKVLKQNIISYKKSFEKTFHNLDHCDYFIVTITREPAYPMKIYRIVKHYLDLFAQTSKRSPHILRHTFATHLLNKGADLNAVKDLLGHANLAATQVYTHNSMEKLKAVFDQAHPKA